MADGLARRHTSHQQYGAAHTGHSMHISRFRDRFLKLYSILPSFFFGGSSGSGDLEVLALARALELHWTLVSLQDAGTGHLTVQPPKSPRRDLHSTHVSPSHRRTNERHELSQKSGGQQTTGSGD